MTRPTLRQLAAPATQLLSPLVVTADSPAFIIPGTLTGRTLRTLMRQYRITIPALSRKMRLTEQRIRQARHDGITGWFSCSEWLQAITGFWFIARPVAVEANRSATLKLANAKPSTRRSAA
jgi:hypothetical protein